MADWRGKAQMYTRFGAVIIVRNTALVSRAVRSFAQVPGSMSLLVSVRAQQHGGARGYDDEVNEARGLLPSRLLCDPNSTLT